MLYVNGYSESSEQTEENVIFVHGIINRYGNFSSDLRVNSAYRDFPKIWNRNAVPTKPNFEADNGPNPTFKTSEEHPFKYPPVVAIQDFEPHEFNLKDLDQLGLTFEPRTKETQAITEDSRKQAKILAQKRREDRRKFRAEKKTAKKSSKGKYGQGKFIDANKMKSAVTDVADKTKSWFGNVGNKFKSAFKKADNAFKKQAEKRAANNRKRAEARKAARGGNNRKAEQSEEFDSETMDEEEMLESMRSSFAESETRDEEEMHESSTWLGSETMDESELREEESEEIHEEPQNIYLSENFDNFYDRDAKTRSYRPILSTSDMRAIEAAERAKNSSSSTTSDDSDDMSDTTSTTLSTSSSSKSQWEPNTYDMVIPKTRTYFASIASQLKKKEEEFHFSNKGAVLVVGPDSQRIAKTLDDPDDSDGGLGPTDSSDVPENDRERKRNLRGGNVRDPCPTCGIADGKISRADLKQKRGYSETQLMAQYLALSKRIFSATLELNQ